MRSALSDPFVEAASRLLATVPAALGVVLLLLFSERCLRARHPLVRPWTTRYALFVTLLPLVGWSGFESLRVRLAAADATVENLRPAAIGLVAVWAVVAFVRVVRTARRARGAARMARTLASLGTRVVGERGAVVACEGDGVPFVCGLLRPRVVVPLGFLDDLDDAAARAALLHELAHARRFDPLRRLVTTLVADLLWFNPFAAWIVRRAEADREGTADRAALSAGVAAGDLARAIVHACDRLDVSRRGAMVASLRGSGFAEIRDRLRTLRRGAGRGRLVFAVVCVALLFPWRFAPRVGPVTRSPDAGNQLYVGLGLGGNPLFAAGIARLFPRAPPTHDF